MEPQQQKGADTWNLNQFGSNKKQDIPYQKVSITEEENTEKYYYQQLPTEQRQVYQEILEGVRNHTEEIYVHNADVDETNQIFQKLMKDQPDIFWCDGTATATTHKGTESYTVLKPKLFLHSRRKPEDADRDYAGGREVAGRSGCRCR